MILLPALLPWSALAAGGGEKATDLIHKAPDPGPQAGWFVKMMVDAYNNNMYMYAFYTIVIMTLMGVILGFFTDKILELVGFETKKLEHHE